MATAGATPPTGDTTKPKRELTPVQKFGLPLVGGLALLVGYMYFPRGSSAPVPTQPSAIANTSAGNSATSFVPPATGGAGLGRGIAVPVSATAPAPAVFVSQARTDPFEPVLLYSPPAPIPTPAPPPPKPKPVLPPVVVAPPSEFGRNDISVSDPLSIADPRVRAEVAQPLNLGSPRISRTSDGAPRDAFPLPRTSGAGGAGGSGAPEQSYDKRLAGVVIGDGVRALLEITAGDQVTTQVVQPGDEVNGIRVLNIERFRDGDRTVTRMLVRDTDGTQRFVDLKPSSQPPVGAGGLGGPGGFPGAAGGFPGGGGRGFPGGPGGFPGAQGGFPGNGG
jgi:hypothetical protein